MNLVFSIMGLIGVLLRKINPNKFQDNDIIYMNEIISITSEAFNNIDNS